MLTHLNIKNFAVVETLAIDLNTGLTAITGETGAGKSIAVDALGLVLGDRADRDIIRDGTERAEISASFDLQRNPDALGWLTQQGLDAEECIIRRLLGRDGRSRAFINGTPVTLVQLRELGEKLMDIHSQHEHQSLLDKKTHRRLLDAFAGAADSAKAVHTAYRHWADKARALAELETELKTRSEQRQLLQYQLEELDSLALEPNELAQLEAEQQRLAGAEQILTTGQHILALTQNGDTDDNSSCQNLISQAVKLSETLQDSHPDLLESRELLNNAQIQLEEAAHSLNAYLANVNIDPQRQQQVEQRLSDIYQLARKHQSQPDALASLHARIKADYAQIDDLDEHTTALRAEVEAARQHYQQAAAELSQKRQAASTSFDKKIAGHLQQLGMTGCRFHTRLHPLQHTDPSPHGVEEVEFLVSTNPGQAPRALNKVASGGELSRISLAIQVMSAQTATLPILVFDEVDVGIGGGTAEVVGQMLRALGDAGQVLCVTHQPQVAAQAHQHLQVSKRTRDESTDSQMRLLEEEERVCEIARMLGGLKLTEQTLAHAREMLRGSA